MLGLYLDDRIFRPTLISGPSGLSNPPRPFILRANGLGTVFARNDEFDIGVHTFDKAGAAAEEIARAFSAARGRGFQLESMMPAGELAIDLGAPEPARFARVRFVTPAELKGAADTTMTLPFSILLARVRDRIANLRRLYGDGPLDIDFRALGERAEKIANGAWCHKDSRFLARRSSRTGQIHSIGGLTGCVEYQGDLGEFAPWLRAAAWTNIGRHTVWGNGQIECEFAI